MLRSEPRTTEGMAESVLDRTAFGDGICCRSECDDEAGRLVGVLLSKDSGSRRGVRSCGVGVCSGISDKGLEAPAGDGLSTTGVDTSSFVAVLSLLARAIISDRADGRPRSPGECWYELTGVRSGDVARGVGVSWIESRGCDAIFVISGNGYSG
jgi:hypothetical protein